MSESNSEYRTSLKEALGRLPTAEGKLSTEIFRRGDLEVKIYAPRGNDPQKPHSRDEIYIVAQGKGFYFCGETRQPFAPGDFLFAPAGVVHRFEDFSDDFAVWAIFFGPEKELPA